MATKKHSTRTKRSTRKLAVNAVEAAPVADDALLAHFTKLFEKKLKASADEPVRLRAFDLAFAAANWVADYEAFLAQ
jgi:hypothetical protein